MIRCARCGSGFSSAHLATDVSCPRCRSKDGVTTTLVATASTAGGPLATESLAEMTRRVERGRARLRGF